MICGDMTKVGRKISVMGDESAIVVNSALRKSLHSVLFYHFLGDYGLHSERYVCAILLMSLWCFGVQSVCQELVMLQRTRIPTADLRFGKL